MVFKSFEGSSLLELPKTAASLWFVYMGARLRMDPLGYGSLNGVLNAS